MKQVQGELRRPQILILSDVFAPTIGGAGVVCQALAEHLPEHITVAASERTDAAEPVADWHVYDRRFPFHVVRVLRFASTFEIIGAGRLRGAMRFAVDLLLTRPLAIVTLLLKLRGRRVDVLCINTLVPCYWAASLLQLFYPRAKIVFYLHGEEVNDAPTRAKLDLLAQAKLRKADAVITVSNFTAVRARRCGVSPGRITVLHNGVDTARFTPGPKNDALLASLGVTGRLVLLCLARLDERKGQDNLIRAMTAVRASVPSAVLVIAGGGADRERLERIAQECGVEDITVFAGRIPDEMVVEYYRSADVYVMPNRTTANGDTEGFGLVFLEAGACGLPVIGGLAGGVPDAFVDGETGILVDGTSVANIAESCVRLLCNEDLRRRMGSAGLSRAQQMTWAHQSAQFLEICEALCVAPAADAPNA